MFKLEYLLSPRRFRFVRCLLGEESTCPSEPDAQRDGLQNQEEIEGIEQGIYSLVKNSTRLLSFCCLPGVGWESSSLGI